MPSTDQCNTCSLLTLQQKTVKTDIHQKREEPFNQQLATYVKQDYCIALDLTEMSFIMENKPFCNRKTWLYNLGVNNQKNVFFNLWTETNAVRGFQEISSCL